MTSTYKKITYICNKCSKTRLLTLPEVLKPTVGKEGYVEFVDVHSCINSHIKANILYVDQHLVVRSQALVDPTLERSSVLEENEMIVGKPIPNPEKREFITQSIVPSLLFEKSHLYKLKIKDKLRQSIYKFDGEHKGISIEDISPLGFIEVTAEVIPEVDTEQANRWISKLVELLERVVLLDEGVLCYLLDYLSFRIGEKPTEKKFLELDLLINSSYALPTTQREQADTIKNKEKWEEMISELIYQDRQMYNRIMKLCLENRELTILTIFVKIVETVSNEYTLPGYMSALANLVTNGFLDIDKFAFEYS